MVLLAVLVSNADEEVGVAHLPNVAGLSWRGGIVRVGVVEGEMDESNLPL